MQLRTCVVAAALATTLLGQGVVPPLQVLQTNPHPGLNPGPVPGASVQQVHMVHLAGDPANVFLTAMTVTGLSGFGGVGGSDLLTGSYDVLTDTFTPDADAGGLNTGGTEFGLMLHHTGLFAAFDRLPGLPHFARRTATGQPWIDVGTINGLPSQSYYDPALADYQGQTYLLHVLGFDIAMTPIDVSTGQLTGASRVIVRAARTGSTANSPTPVLAPNGELIGLSHHDVLASDNDHYMSLDLDPLTPAVLMNDTTTWTNNGGFVGGRFFDAESSPSPYHVFSMDTFWCTGGRGPIGSTIDVTMYTPPTTGTEFYLSGLVLSLGFSPTGLTIPGFQGQIGVQLQTAVWNGSLILHDNNNGVALASIAVPNTPSLSGIRLAAQSATVEVASNVFRFGNTAALIVD